VSTVLHSQAAERRHASAPSPGEIVRVERLSKRFPVRRGWRDLVRHPRGRRYASALDEVSFAVAPGEFFGLLGPNGAGKTTLFKILATLIEPDQGSARVAGLDVVRNASGVRDLLTPVIASERSLAWRLSARENLDVFAALHRLPPGQIRSRVDEVLDIVELAETGRKMVGEFSSGMRQRLLIARALISSPRVLLLDEPTRSLDPVSARRFRTFLREEIVGRQGCTVLLATHNTEEALDLCDRVAILNHGKILALGSANELSKEVAQDRFRIWTADPVHPAWRGLAQQGLIGDVRARSPDGDEWAVLEVNITGQADDAPAQVLAFMVESGVRIARFEKFTPSLAEVIDHVILRSGKVDG